MQGIYIFNLRDYTLGLLYIYIRFYYPIVNYLIFGPDAFLDLQKVSQNENHLVSFVITLFGPSY